MAKSTAKSTAKNSDPTGNDPSRGELARRGPAAYQGALEAVAAIAIAALIGYWVDRRLDTSPRWLTVGTIVGFGSFVLRLWRMRRLFEGHEPPAAGGPNE
jgi:F0F1-type ATP synthase assembly protein I